MTTNDKTREALRLLTLAVEQNRNCDFNSEHPAVESAMKEAYAALASTPAAQGEAVEGAVWDEFNGGVALVKRGHEDAHVSKWGGSRLYRPTPERAEVRPPVRALKPIEVYEACRPLYGSSVAADMGRLDDAATAKVIVAKFCDVNGITPPSAADSAQGQQQGEAQP